MPNQMLIKSQVMMKPQILIKSQIIEMLQVMMNMLNGSEFTFSAFLPSIVFEIQN